MIRALVLSLILSTSAASAATPPPPCKPTCDCRRDDCYDTEPCCPQRPPVKRLGPNATNCTTRREACRTMTLLCHSGSVASCSRAKLCWVAVERDCGK